MKKVMFLLISFCVILSLNSFGQERQDETRKKLQISLDAQSERLTNIPGWSRMENQDGKFWKQSGLTSTSTESYLPCCPNEAFQYVQTYKFTLEGQAFYLLTIKYDNHYFRTFAFKDTSLKRLEDIINAADGKTYNALEIEYCEIYIDINSEVLFDPELVIQNKIMIRSLLLGEKPPKTVGNGGCKGNYFFKINTQILKGEKIVRFNTIPKDDSYAWQDNTLPTNDNYFELKKSEFEKLFEFTPYENELKYSKQGDEKYKGKDYAGAISEYTNAIRLNPTDPSTYNLRGLSKYSLEDYSGALEDFSKAIELCPKEDTSPWIFQIEQEGIANFYLNRANCKLLLNDYQGVINDVSNYTKWYIGTEGSLFLSAQANWGLENYTAALDNFSWLILDKSDGFGGYKEGYNGSYHSWRSSVYLRLNDYDKAIIDCSELIKINPESSDGYFNRAYAKSKLKDYSGALSDYNKTIELSPKETISYVKRAAIKNHLQDFAGAIADCTKALEIDPEVDIFLNRGVAEIKLGQKDSGCADFKKAVELGSEEAKNFLLIYCK